MKIITYSYMPPRLRDNTEIAMAEAIEHIIAYDDSGGRIESLEGNLATAANVIGILAGVLHRNNLINDDEFKALIRYPYTTKED
jgi:hypothetical protein